MRGYFFGTTISYKLYNISKIMTICQVFPDHQKCYFKEASQNKTIIMSFSFTKLQRCIKHHLPNIGISIGHFFKALYDNLNLSDLKTLPKGAPIIFLVCQQKLYNLRFHEKMNNIFYKATHSQQRRNKNQENVFHMIPVWTLYFSFHQGLQEIEPLSCCSSAFVISFSLEFVSTTLVKLL